MDRDRADAVASLIAAGLTPTTEGGPFSTFSPLASASANSQKRSLPRSQVDRLLEDQQWFAAADEGAPPGSHARATSDVFPFSARFSPAPGNASASQMAPTHFATSTAASLQDAVMRWGVVDNGSLDGSGVETSFSHVRRSLPDGASAAPSFIRHSWRLIEVTRGNPAEETAGDGASLSFSNVRSLGRRWERADDLLQTHALAQAAQAELPQLPKAPRADTDGGQGSAAMDAFYDAGLRLCAESARSAASLRACLSAPSPSLNPTESSVAFFTFTREEYDALPPPLPSSTYTVTSASSVDSFPFTYASSAYLLELWGRFGNPVLVVDRWNWKDSLSCSFSSGAAAALQHGQRAALHEREEARSLGGQAGAIASTFFLPAPPRRVPTVEEVCAEYTRVTTGVLQQRRQRLLQVVLAQQRQQRQEEKHCANTAVAAHSRASNTRTPTAPSSASTTAPFVASFDRYALLHSSTEQYEEKQEKEEAREAGHSVQQPQLQLQPNALAAPTSDTAEQTNDEASSSLAQMLPSQPSPAPTDLSSSPIAAHVEQNKREAFEAAAATPAASSPLAGLTSAQQVVFFTTPSPWYRTSSEVFRRCVLAEVLEREAATNVPYQQAVESYLKLATSAAQALQRAAYIFDDRDRDEEADEEEARTRATGGASSTSPAPAQDTSPLSSSIVQVPSVSGVPARRRLCPPREAFAVLLSILPNVDPAAWRAAETAVRKAAVEVLGVDGATVLSLTSSSSSSSRKMTRRGVSGGREKRPRVTTAAVAADADDDDDAAKLKGGAAQPKRGARRRVKAKHGTAVAKEEPAGNIHSDSDEEAEQGEDAASGSSESSVGSCTESEEEEGDSDGDTSKEEREDDTAARNETVRSARTGEERKRSNASKRPRKEDAPSSGKKRNTSANRGPTRTADPSYRSTLAYLTDVIPFHCTRLRLAAQAGWLLPAPPPLPHALVEPFKEEEVVPVSIAAVGAATAAANATERSNETKKDALPASPTTTSANASFAFAPAAGATGAAATVEAPEIPADLLTPILTEEAYKQLHRVCSSGVCNRVVSHTGEAVLLSLPAQVPVLHREVEQELERYLYDDTTALLEVGATAQQLLADIRVAYTQNTQLQRYLTRLEHVAENVHKVWQDAADPTTSGG